MIKYKNPLLNKMVKKIMLHGKLELAESIVAKALAAALKAIEKEGIKTDVEELFQQAINNGSPSIGVKSKRVRGSNCQIPVPLTKTEGGKKAMQFILNCSRNKKGYSMIDCLSHTLIDTYKNQGEVIKLRNESHKQSEAQKAFAHLTPLVMKKETV